MEFVGDTNPQTLKSIVIENTQNNSKSSLDVSGAFIAIGHDPATSLFKNKLEMVFTG
mgnify:FL=1